MAVVSPAPLLLDSLSPARFPALAVLSSKPLIDQRSNMLGLAKAISHLMLTIDTKETDSNVLQKDCRRSLFRHALRSGCLQFTGFSLANMAWSAQNRLLYRCPARSLYLPVSVLHTYIPFCGCET